MVCPGSECFVFWFNSSGQASINLAAGGAWGKSPQCSLCLGGFCRECEIGGILSREGGAADSFGAALHCSSC